MDIVLAVVSLLAQVPERLIAHLDEVLAAIETLVQVSSSVGSIAVSASVSRGPWEYAFEGAAIVAGGVAAVALFINLADRAFSQDPHLVISRSATGPPGLYRTGDAPAMTVGVNLHPLSIELDGYKADKARLVKLDGTAGLHVGNVLNEQFIGFPETLSMLLSPRLIGLAADDGFPLKHGVDSNAQGDFTAIIEISYRGRGQRKEYRRRYIVGMRAVFRAGTSAEEGIMWADVPIMRVVALNVLPAWKLWARYRWAIRPVAGIVWTPVMR